MRVHRKLLKTPLGIIQYVWLEGGLVPYDVLMQEWRETLFDTKRMAYYPKAGEETPKTLVASYN